MGGLSETDDGRTDSSRPSLVFIPIPSADPGKVRLDTGHRALTVVAASRAALSSPWDYGFEEL
jgi:inorganic pyrophosphatase